MRISLFCLVAISTSLLRGQELVKVTAAKPVDKKLRLPGEIVPYERVDIMARVNGYVTQVLVDRGSPVRKGQLLVSMAAPEMAAQIAEAQSRVKTAESRKAEAEARLSSQQATLERLRAAAKTPGAIAGLELVQAEKSVDASRAAVAAADDSIVSAKAAVAPLKDLEGYLKITAPFDGIVTERLVHPGALAGPASGALLRIENNHRLRLIVPVPETEAGAIPRGARITFTVPAHPGMTFDGVIARNPQSMDPKTRTLPLELEVTNPKGLLAPGMYPEVSWPLQNKSGAGLVAVPATAVVTTTERVFVIRARGDGTAEWVNVKKGPAQGEMVLVSGALAEGDSVVKRATDEIRQGTKLR